MQIFLTILGGIIAGGVGLGTAIIQEIRKRKRNLLSLYFEINRNLDLLNTASSKEFINLEIPQELHTTAYQVTNSSGDLSILPRETGIAIMGAYETIFTFQEKVKSTKSLQRLGISSEAVQTTLTTITNALLEDLVNESFYRRLQAALTFAKDKLEGSIGIK